MRAVTHLRRVLAALALGAPCAIGVGCAGFSSERHLAPLFTELSTAGGGTEIEALGGAVRVRRSAPHGFYEQWAVRPLAIRDLHPDGSYITHFLTPLGIEKNLDPEYVWQLLPIARYSRTERADGDREWTFISLPGIYWARTSDGRILRAWFPFGGVLENFLSFDRIEFVLFPLYTRTERSGNSSYQFLWPFFAYTHGPTASGGHFWPFYGRSTLEDGYDRFFILWPIFHWHENRLALPPEQREVKWMFFPIIGQTRRGTFRSTTVLWPFFGYAEDPSTGFWSWDGPWPLVRFMDSPKEGTSRFRLWPLFWDYHGDGLDSRWIVWPLVNVRHEEYENATKNSVYLIPFWQNWKRVDADAGRSSYQKLWPFYEIARTGEQSYRWAFPALNPLWRTIEVDEMYSWIYELYTRERDHEHIKERTWLGLWRREKDADEDRSSLVGVWAGRRYREDGRTVHETSLLFGLIRWRTREGGSLEWMWPSLPGPGWPLKRVPRAASDALPSPP